MTVETLDVGRIFEAYRVAGSGDLVVRYCINPAAHPTDDSACIWDRGPTAFPKQRLPVVDDQGVLQRDDRNRVLLESESDQVQEERVRRDIWQQAMQQQNTATEPVPAQPEQTIVGTLHDTGIVADEVIAAPVTAVLAEPTAVVVDTPPVDPVLTIDEATARLESAAVVAEKGSGV